MITDISTQIIVKDEYTQKAQDLYATLNINKDSHLTIEQIAQEYNELLQSTMKKSIEDSTFYINR